MAYYLHRLSVLALLVLSLMTVLAVQAQDKPGKAQYNKVCSVCHGMEGRGDAGPGPSLVPMDRDYKEVLSIVREGIGEMPPIAKERLSDEEVKQIVEYLKSLPSPSAHD
jgi:mono/diheme cytochrome c family protein